MKKIFTTVLFAAATISFAAAQSKKDIAFNNKKQMSNDYGKHDAFDKNSKNSDYFLFKEKEAKLQKINREYDQKIAMVKSSRRLNGREKTKQIQWLQNERNKEINQVERQYVKSHDQRKW